MIKLKTAIEILDTWDVEYLNESTRSYYSTNVCGTMQEYADQSTKALQEDNERLKEKLIEQVGLKQCLEISNSDHLDHIHSLEQQLEERNISIESIEKVDKLQSQIESLQEQNNILQVKCDWKKETIESLQADKKELVVGLNRFYQWIFDENSESNLDKEMSLIKQLIQKHK